MGLSAHELILVLRARDEASRVLRGFSDNLGKFETAAAAEEIAAITATKNADLAATRTRLEANQALVAAHKGKIASYQQDILLERQAMAATTNRYALEQQRIRSSATTTRAMKQVQLQAIKDVYVTQRAASNANVANKQREIIKEKSYIRLLEKEIGVIKAQRAQVKLKAAEDIAGIRDAQAAEAHRLAQRKAQQNSLFMKGTATATVGVGLAGAGAVGIYALNGLTKASAEYTQQAAKTLTQADEFNTSLEDLRNIGREVAAEVPADFSQVQDSMYDILSSLDLVGKSAQEQRQYFVDLTKGIATASVGGQTSMETAGRAIIQILNAWGEEAGGVNTVNDVMFQLVRKGVGTYDEFAKTIGRAAPSARKSGQSIQTLSGMLAFMTRNGMSAAMSATSAARALDSISKTQTQKKLKEIGVNVTDSNGKFRSMVDIMTDLRGKLSGLTDKARATKLNDIFGRGTGGTIQAMRFFNLAVIDSKGSLQKLTKSMKESKGAAKEAYDTMKNTPEAAAQELTNQYKIMATTLGEDLMPLKIQLLQALSDILKWFNNLDPGVRKNIVMFAALAAGLSVILGIVLVVVGGIVMLAAAGAALGVGLAGMIGIIAGVVAALAAIGGIAYLIITNWDAIKAFFQPFIDGLVSGWQNFVTIFTDSFKAFDPVWELFRNTIANIWEELMGYFQEGIDSVVDMYNYWKPTMDELGAGFGEMAAKVDPLIKAIANFAGIAGTLIGGVVVTVFTELATIVGTVWRFLTAVFANMLPGLMAFGQGVVHVIGGIIDVFTGIFTLDWNKFIAGIGQIVGGLMEMVGGILGTAVGFIWGIIKGLVDGIIGFFVYLYNVIVGHSIIPDLVNAIITWIASLPGQVLGFISSMVSGVIGFFVRLAVQAGVNVMILVARVVAFAKSLPGRFIAAVSALAGMLRSAGLGWLAKLLEAVVKGAATVIGWFRDLPKKIINAIGNVGNLLYNAGQNILMGLWNGLKNIWNNITKWVGDIAGWIRDHKGPLSYDLGLLAPAGAAIMTGFYRSMVKGYQRTKKFVKSVAADVRSGLDGNNGFGFDPGTSSGTASSGKTINVKQTVNTQEINPRKHAADLAWQLASELGL